MPDYDDGYDDDGYDDYDSSGNDRRNPPLEKRVAELERLRYELSSQLAWVKQQAEAIREAQSKKSNREKALELLIVHLIARDERENHWSDYLGWLQGIEENSELMPRQKEVLAEVRLVVASAIDEIERQVAAPKA